LRPDAAAFLWDARRAAELVQQFCSGLTVDDYVADLLVRSAVERQLAIVGEALNRLRKSDPETADDVTDLVRIISFRNILVHGYTSVDSFLVWRLVTTNLPVLLADLERLLAGSPE
jgi:uncharacterized protein with HEPN domain